MLKIIILAAASSCFAQGPSASAEVAVSTPPATVEGLYRPINARDPLVPSTFFGDHKPRFGGAAAAAEIPLSSSTIGGLSLTGVMEDSSGRQAMLTDKASGAVYILKGGKLLDSRRKAVAGVRGAIRGKQVELTMGGASVTLNLHGK
ncbi:MAG: hypothetical protein FD189_1869 [Elusimicrobia bacterium]|nr:MAG: hypothetical protein FD154_2046 [Elusimicrobiota bacterium]KAF0154491.1 MAG: hypothetical protein FD189_1869 [Elusimicrobiota bacterium]